MRIFLSTILVGFLLEATFVYLIDPSYRWRDSITPFSRDLLDDEIRISPANFDERTVKLSQMKYIEKPDILLLGSSRVRIVSSDHFPPGLRIFNGGLSSSTFEDEIALWQAFKEMGKIPKKVIIFFDSWQLNKNFNSEMTGWLNIAPYFNRFQAAHNLEEYQASPKSPSHSAKKTIPERIEKMSRQIKKNLDLVSDILSWSMFKASFKLFLKHGLFSERSTQLIIKKADLQPEDSGILKDGSFVYPQTELTPKPKEKLITIVQDVATKPNNKFDHWEFDDRGLEKLRSLLMDMVSQNISVLIIQPPMHSLFKKLTESKVNIPSPFFPRSIEFSPLISFCNREDLAIPLCADDEMMDEDHMLPSCSKKVIRSCTAANFRQGFGE